MTATVAATTVTAAVTTGATAAGIAGRTVNVAAAVVAVVAGATTTPVRAVARSAPCAVSSSPIFAPTFWRGTTTRLPPMPRDDATRRMLLFGALIGVLAASLVGADLISRNRTADTRVRLNKTLTYGELTIALPSGFQPTGEPVEEFAGEPVIFSAVQRLPRPPSRDVADAVAGDRRISVLLERPPRLMPPAQYLNEVYRAPVLQTRPFKVGPYAGGALFLNVRDAEPPPGNDTPVMRAPADPTRTFVLLASATLPSGRVLTLRLTGPGAGTRGDIALLTRVAESIALASEPLVPPDPLERLRDRPLPSVLSHMDLGQLQGRPRLSEVVVVADGGSGDIAVIEVLPVPFPVDPEKAEPFARKLAELYERPLVDAKAIRVTDSRLLLSPKRNQQFALKAMAVTTRGGSALLMGRGGPGSEERLRILLNRVADRLTFEPHTEDFAVLSEAGHRLARSLSTLSTPESLVLHWQRDAGGPGTLGTFGWTHIDGPAGTLENRRRQSPLLFVSRSLRSARSGPGGTTQLFRRWDAFVPNSGFQSVLALESTLPPAQETPATEFDLAGRGQLVPGHRLLALLASAERVPAIVITDSLPLLDLDTRDIRLPVLLAPAPQGTRAWFIHLLGSGQTVLVRYDAAGNVAAIEAPSLGAVATPVAGVDSLPSAPSEELRP
jgi:hypothetical protein